jgi:hypothetical protein
MNHETEPDMSLSLHDLGPQDPELKNSPIAGEMDEDREFPRQDAPGTGCCYFNDRAFEHGTFIKSGAVIFKCHHGVWMESGPGDPENP